MAPAPFTNDISLLVWDSKYRLRDIEGRIVDGTVEDSWRRIARALATCETDAEGWASCGTILSSGARRGAMMATLRCDHPDIETFIGAKRMRELTNFNLSVLVTDDFMQAVAADVQLPLVFPDSTGEGETMLRRWSGGLDAVPCRVHRRIPARQLWGDLMRAAYDCAEPGVLFIDRINRLNNLWYREHISATNPCGEIPLPPYGACDLGSINLVPFVRAPFTRDASLDLAAIEATARVAVRMLDNVIDVSRFPLQRQTEMARGSRRIGLGITGLADALIMLGTHYGGPEARALAVRAMSTISHAAYRCSIELAREKGPFPYFERDRYLQGERSRALPADIRSGIAGAGIRNSHLTAIAPTGTISLLASNVSSGIEPVYALRHRRRMQGRAGEVEHELVDHAFALWRELRGNESPPAVFVDTAQLTPTEHLDMQAALQPYVDNSISKTINVPVDLPFRRLEDVYRYAFDRGLKGCTVFRPNEVTGAILRDTADGTQVLCCGVGREAD